MLWLRSEDLVDFFTEAWGEGLILKLAGLRYWVVVKIIRTTGILTTPSPLVRTGLAGS